MYLRRMQRRTFLEALAALSAAFLVPVRAAQTQIQRVRERYWPPLERHVLVEPPIPVVVGEQDGRIVARVLRSAVRERTLALGPDFEAAMDDCPDLAEGVVGHDFLPESRPYSGPVTRESYWARWREENLPRFARRS